MKFTPVVGFLLFILLGVSTSEVKRRPRRGIKDIYGNTLSYILITLTPTPTLRPKVSKNISSTQTISSRTPIAKHL
ncbi:hypothetical protein K7432_003175 [Basidiobolus ranarum]|uniref:Uncharacterized protein n=1 Tax=Basidiobolus ranarum TaxID=34480 RepID=A0ABR2W6L6_9FUNG